jgi:mycofactocin precursor
MGARWRSAVDCRAMDDELIAEYTDTAVAAEPAEIVDELLIEEISIDGMCGVY